MTVPIRQLVICLYTVNESSSGILEGDSWQDISPCLNFHNKTPIRELEDFRDCRKTVSKSSLRFEPHPQPHVSFSYPCTSLIGLPKARPSYLVHFTDLDLVTIFCQILRSVSDRVHDTSLGGEMLRTSDQIGSSSERFPISRV